MFKELFNNMKFIWNFGKKKKIVLIKFIIANIVVSILSVFIPIINANLIVNLTNNKLNELLMLAILLFIVNTSWYFIDLLATFYKNKIFNSVYIDLQTELGNKFLKIQNENIDKNGTGLFIERFTTDVEKLSDIFSVINGYLSDVICYLGMFVTILITSKYVFVYLILSTILLSIMEHQRSNIRNNYDKKYRVEKEKISSVISEIVRGSKDIKMLNSEKSFLKYFYENICKLNKTKYTSETIQEKYSFKKQVVSNILDLLLIILMIILIKDNMLSLVSALIIYNYSKQTRWVTQIIGQMLDELNTFNLSTNRIKALFYDDYNFKKEKFGKKHLNKIKGNFEFKNVAFSYGKNKIFEDLNFKINANETVAFVGKSGAGKTTIFNLLCKMYDIDSGKITIDEIDINELDKQSIRGNITIISQNPYIFNLSIKENLKLVKANITDKEIKEACKIACLDEFINSLPQKYDTIIGEGGVNLSGGQKQRLAIARALIQKTEIILFDEATSSLDNETQSKISQAINNMKGEYTILIIAHRLSTIVNSDRILYLENGKIVAEGTHNQLLEISEEYRKLYESQLKNDKNIL